MAYVHKLLTQGEDMIGVARLHWIYVLKGISWFLVLALAGWIAQSVIMQGLSYLADGLNTNSLTTALMPLLNFVILIPMAVGFSIFVFNVIKVLSTEIGLSSRRIIKKTGWLFVKVTHIDLEEIRGENMDTGILGRFLGYAYVDLDCRFIGDVKIDAIEKPNLFVRHLHKARAESQDSIKIVMGKSGIETPINLVPPQGADGGQNPEIAPPKPATPEISPPSAPQEIPEPIAPPAIDPPSPSQPPTKDALPPMKPSAPAEKKEEQPVQQTAAPLDPQMVAQIVQQVMPQMAQEVVKQMTEQGLIPAHEEAKDEIDIDTALIHSFDEARIKGESKGNDLHDKVEPVIH